MSSSRPNPSSLESDQEAYASSEDSDFAPEEDNANARDGGDDSSASHSEAEATAASPSQKRKRNVAWGDQPDADFENSGDEAIISRGQRKQKKRKGGDGGEGTAGMEDGDEDAGPLIKTRAMKAVEKTQRARKLPSGPTTVDVNALWADMISTPSSKPQLPYTSNPPPQASPSSPSKNPAAAVNGEPGDPDTDTILMKRTYTFAGRTVTETKSVPLSSAEARLYLASNPEASEPQQEQDTQKRTLRRAFRSAFEPLAPGDATAAASGKRTDLNLGMANLMRLREDAAAKEAKKLTTVEKSRMDWAKHVDKEGMREELEIAGRAKHNYGDRTEFLARVEGRKEDEHRRVRMGGKV